MTYLNSSADRWNSYIAYNPTVRTAIAGLVPGWDGLSLASGQLNMYNNSGSNTIASCGPYNYVDLESAGPGVQFNTVDFVLNINEYYASTYSSGDWINIITHELGHALGIGLYWSSDFLSEGSIPPVNFFLDGSGYTNCRAAYDSITSDSSPRSQIPLEDTGGVGTSSAHWEDDYRSVSYTGSNGYNYPGVTNELMVGTIGPGDTRILSTMSTKILVDFGYEEKSPGTSEGIPSLDLSALNINAQQNENQSKLNCTCDHKPNKIGTVNLNS